MRQSRYGQQAFAGTIATLPLALIQVSANKELRERSLSPRKLITIYLNRYRSCHAVIGLGMGSGVSKRGSFWGKYSAPENEIDEEKVPFLPVEDRYLKPSRFLTMMRKPAGKEKTSTLKRAGQEGGKKLCLC